MEDEEIFFESYENISDEVKYISNSLIRLKLLAVLYESPLNMKEINEQTHLSYSSISSNMHGLELRGYVYREFNKYHLSNDMRMHVDDILELKEVMHLLNNFFNIIDGHIIDLIPNESVAELYLLGKANLIESNGVDVYKILNYIDNSLNSASYVKAILPIYYGGFSELLKKEVTELFVFEKITEIFEQSLGFELNSFDCENCFLLIITDEIMLLGLFKEDGTFDQNRLLASKNEECIEWAENLFENFKNKVINENQTHL